MKLIHKFRTFLGYSHFLQFKLIIEKIFGFCLRVNKFNILVLSNYPDKKIRGFGEIREASPKDIPGMCLLVNKGHVFEQWFSDGNHCIVAIHENEIIGYEWYSTKPFHVEDRFMYKLMIPSDAIYLFDAFINPAYRLRGTWVLFKKYFMEKSVEIGRNKIFVMIDFSNIKSLKTHMRFGFELTEEVLVYKVFGKYWHSNKMKSSKSIS